MTTIDERPSDEMTGKVVAKQFGIEGDNPFTLIGKVFHYDWDNDFYDDPRECTDAAMELLWKITDDIDIDRMYPCNALPNGGWLIRGVFLPISGPGLRYGIVRIAAEVMGVEG